MSGGPGDQILELMRDQDGPVVLVCPFIKAPVVARLLGLMGERTDLDVYTRWLPAEVASGVSDLEVFDLVRDRGGSLLLLRELHAKVYMRGRVALVGSANLTGPGTGWTGQPGLELLVEIDAGHPGVQGLLTLLSERAQPATETIRTAVELAARALKEDRPRLAELLTDQQPLQERAGVWSPQSPDPRRLWQVYASDDNHVLEQTRIRAQTDLAYLQPPSGLDRQMFVAHVRAMLQQSAVLAVIDQELSAPGAPDPPAALADSFDIEPEEAAMAWEVARDWLLHFFPDRYRAVAPASAVSIIKSRQA